MRKSNKVAVFQNYFQQRNTDCCGKLTKRNVCRRDPNILESSNRKEKGSTDSLHFKILAVQEAHESSHAVQIAQRKESFMGYWVCFQNGWWVEEFGFLYWKNFNLNGSGGFKCYWRNLRKEQRSSIIWHSGGGSVMIRACSSYHGKSCVASLIGRQNSSS